MDTTILDKTILVNLSRKDKIQRYNLFARPIAPKFKTVCNFIQDNRIHLLFEVKAIKQGFTYDEVLRGLIDLYLSGNVTLVDAWKSVPSGSNDLTKENRDNNI